MPRTVARAVAIADGKILKVGGNPEVLALAGPECRKIDLQGKTITPGLIDSHYHLMYYGQQFWPGYLNIREPEVGSKADLLRVVGERAKQLNKGDWISANQGFHLRPGETLDRSDMDQGRKRGLAFDLAVDSVSFRQACVKSFLAVGMFRGGRQA